MQVTLRGGVVAGTDRAPTMASDLVSIRGWQHHSAEIANRRWQRWEFALLLTAPPP